MAKKGGLGKGLSALLSQTATTNANDIEDTEIKLNLEAFDNVKVTKNPAKKLKEEKLQELVQTLKVGKLKPGKYQPRQLMDDTALNELAESIKNQGLLQPVIVREIEEGYEIIAGERRWRAARIAGLKEIPVIVREVTDENAMLIALIENLQREDLNVLEEARAINRLINEFNLTHKKVAELLGKSRESISNTLRLLNLNKDVKWLLEHGKIEMGHARALLTLEDSEQSRVAELVVKKRLSVRETEALIKQMDGKASLKTKSYIHLPEVFQPQLDKLSNTFKTKVDIKTNKSGDGKLIIHYKDVGQLENLLDWLVN